MVSFANIRCKKKRASLRTNNLPELHDVSAHLRDVFEGHPPLVVSPYDAELYGHWWFEGPQFIDFFFKKLHFDQSEIQAITPGDFLDSGIPIQVQRPTASSWGEKGYYKVWINEGNSWIYPFQHEAERRMTALANRFLIPSSKFQVPDSDNPEPGTRNSELMVRILNQAAYNSPSYGRYLKTSPEFEAQLDTIECLPEGRSAILADTSVKPNLSDGESKSDIPDI